MPVQIKAKCSCGAEFEIVDSTGQYATRGGEPDVMGRRYRYEVLFDQWRNDHLGCITEAENQGELHLVRVERQ